MKPMLEKFWQWILWTDYVRPFVVSKKEYERSESRMRYCEEHLRERMNEIRRLQDELYSNTFRPFEQLIDKSEISSVPIPTIDFRGETFGVQCRIPDMRFYSTRDFKLMSLDVIDAMTKRLTAAFSRHVKNQLVFPSRVADRN